MVSIGWCLRQMKGLRLTKPDLTRSYSYLKKAEDSLAVMRLMERSETWTAAATYYTFYYSLYAIMLRIGITCEIHACSLEFMKRFLVPPYSERDMVMIGRAFINRNNLQYYTDRPVSREEIEEAKKYCAGFYTATKDSLAGMKLSQVAQIRDRLTKGL